jgi:hypothetical protein
MLLDKKEVQFSRNLGNRRFTVESKNPKTIITAQEVATYVVCPEAWRLKQLHRARKPSDIKDIEYKQQRRDWLSQLSFSVELRRYAKIVYILLVLVVIAVFISDQNKSSKFRRSLRERVQKVQQELKAR